MRLFAIQTSLKIVYGKDNYPTPKSYKNVSNLWKLTGQHTVPVPHLWVWLTVANRNQVYFSMGFLAVTRRQTLTWHWMTSKSRKSRGKTSLQGSNEVFTTSISLTITPPFIISCNHRKTTIDQESPTHRFCPDNQKLLEKKSIMVSNKPVPGLKHQLSTLYRSSLKRIGKRAMKRRYEFKFLAFT